MAAITGSMEEGTLQEGEAPAGLGAVRSQPRELASMHRGLTSTHWLRSAVGWYLQKVKLRHEWDGDELILRVVDAPMSDGDGPYIPRGTVGWSQMPGPMREAKVWSFKNSKMNCPSFDLPTGAGTVGGTCPGAQEGQSINPGRRGVLPNGQPVHIEKAICMSCITGDALIMVRGEGLRRIEEMLGRDFEVWSGKSWQKTKVKFMGNKPTVEVSTSNGLSVRATADHQFLTQEGWVAAAELELDTRLPMQLPSDSPSPDQVPTGLSDEALGVTYRTEKRGSLPVQWSRELGAFLGYLIGDGSFYENTEYPTTSLVAADFDSADLQKFVTLVAGWTGSEAELKLRQAEVSSFVKSAGVLAHVNWRSKALTSMLRHLGLKKEGRATRTPKSVWSASREGVAGYLSGLFSTDGSVGIRGDSVELSFANTSEVLIDEVQQLLLSFGIRTSRCEYKSNRERGYKPLWKLSIGSIDSVRAFSERIGFFNQRKQAALTEVLSRTAHRKSRETSYWVTSVESTGKVENVFDLIDVGPEAQFVVNGLSVHNCYGEVGPIAYTNNQVRQMMRHVWTAGMVKQAPEQLAEVLTESILAMPDRLFSPDRNKPAPGNILPIRLHTVGDFFSPEYAAVWIEVCNRVAASGERGARFRFWAPTRTWAAPGWAKHWPELARQLKQPNLVVRPSAFHFDDPAPAPLARGLGAGSTSMHVHDKAAELKRTNFLMDPTNPYFDWMCPTYSARENQLKSCAQSPNPDGQGTTHCRACWTRPDLRIEYPAH